MTNDSLGLVFSIVILPLFVVGGGLAFKTARFAARNWFSALLGYAVILWAAKWGYDNFYDVKRVGPVFLLAGVPSAVGALSGWSAGLFVNRRAKRAQSDIVDAH